MGRHQVGRKRFENRKQKALARQMRLGRRAKKQSKYFMGVSPRVGQVKPKIRKILPYSQKRPSIVKTKLEDLPEFEIPDNHNERIMKRYGQKI